MFFLFFVGCAKDDQALSSQVDLPDSNLLRPDLGNEMEGGGHGTKGCQCYYQILEIDATPVFPANSGGPDYYFYGAVQDSGPGTVQGCSGTVDDCLTMGNPTMIPCWDMSAYVSVAEDGCMCYDLDCTDFIYDDLVPDDQNGSIYPTEFLPFRCQTPLFSEMSLIWQPYWNTSDCTFPFNIVAAGSTITFRIMCVDPNPLPEGCPSPPYQPQANVSPPITITLNQNGEAFKSVELIDCGCEPIEQ